MLMCLLETRYDERLHSVLFFYTVLNTSVYIKNSLSNEFEKMLVCMHARVYVMCVCMY